MDSLPHLMDSIHSGLVLGSPDTPRLGPAEAGFSHSSSPIFPLCKGKNFMHNFMLCTA